jgi:hypothetical protein
MAYDSGLCDALFASHLTGQKKNGYGDESPAAMIAGNRDNRDSRDDRDDRGWSRTGVEEMVSLMLAPFLTPGQTRLSRLSRSS